MRRLHGPATLNGSRFDEAPLTTGDRLRIGSVELELVECSQPLPQPVPMALPGAPTSAEVVELQSKLEDALEQVKRLEGESRQAFESSMLAAERANQLRDALAAAHGQLAGTGDDLAAAQETIASQSDQLIDCQRQLKDCQQQLNAVRADEPSHLALVEQLRSELAELRATTEKERRSLESDRVQLERRLTHREAEIEALRNSPAVQSGAMTVALGEQSVNHEEIQAELKAKLAELEQGLSAKQCEIESLQKLVEQHASVQHRLERLAKEYDAKCGELEDIRQQATVAAATNSVRANDLEERNQALTRWQEELAKREAAHVETRQQIAADQEQIATDRAHIAENREATLALSQQVAADRARIEAEQAQLAQQREQLAIEQAGFADARQQLAQSQANQQVQSEQQAILNERASELESQLAAASARLTELGELQERLVDERAALELQHDQIKQRCQASELREQELEARSLELAAKVEQVQALQNELDEQVAALAGRPVAPADEGTPIACSPESREPVGEIANQEVEAGMVSPPAEAAERQPQQPALQAPENLNDSASVSSVLSRLVKAGLWRGDGSPAAESESEQPAIMADVQPPSDASSVDEIAPAVVELDSTPERPRHAAESGHDEESIESYMERLMKRVRGDSSVAESSALPSPTPMARPTPQVTPAPVAPGQPPPAPEPSMMEPSEFSPRRTAPEQGTDLTAMRALANSAARSAIDRHVRQHTGKQATGKLFGACFTVAASLILSFWAWKAHSWQAAAGAAIGGGIGAFWTFAAIRRLSTLTRLNMLHQDSTEAKKPSGD